jgi:hypothetical protein
MPLVLDSDYNNLRTRIVDVMGTTTNGYGQTLNATANVLGNYAVNTTSTSKITAQQWNNLYIDMIRARVHQVAGFTQQPLWTGNYAVNAAATDKVLTVDLTYLQSLMTTIENNRYALDLVNQASVTVLKTQTFTNWNGLQTATVTLTFATAAARSYFFNSGSRIRFSITNNYVGADTKTNEWITMFNQIGNIAFNHTETFSELGSGTGSPIGGNGAELTTTNQLLYTRAASTYTGNVINIRGRATSATVLVFDLELNDANVGIVDENVQGTTTVSFSMARANGTVTIGGTPYNTVVVTGPTAV